MSETPQDRVVRSDRRRLIGRDVVRLELRTRAADSDLFRSLAIKLMVNDQDADDLRRIIEEKLGVGVSSKGGVLRALMNSPFAGSDLDLSHPFDPGRSIDL